MKFTLTITLDVDLDDTYPEDIESNLGYIAINAANNGLFTGDSLATVSEWDYEVSSE